MIVAPLAPPARRSVGTRLRVDVMDPHAHCPLTPLSLQALWAVTHRPARWDGYGWCAHGCPPCPRAVDASVRVDAPTVIREDEDGHPWLMNRQDAGWGERGIRLRSWGWAVQHLLVEFGELGRDVDGRFIHVTPLPHA